MKNEKIKYTLIGFVEGFVTMLLIAAFVFFVKGCPVKQLVKPDANNSGDINTSVDGGYGLTPRVKTYDDPKMAEIEDKNNYELTPRVKTYDDPKMAEIEDKNNYGLTPRVKTYDDPKETNNKGQKTLSVLAANKIVVFKDDSSPNGSWTIEIPKNSYGNDIFETKTRKLRIVLGYGNEITSSRSVSDYE